MFKKISLILIAPIFVLALEMPPMPPFMELQKTDVNKTTKIKDNEKSTTPKECELLPPMVFMLPPPMEDMVGKCKNQLLMPKTDNKNIVKLFGKNAKIVKIKIIEGFNNLYEINVNKKSYICNKNISKCFEKSKMIEIKE